MCWWKVLAISRSEFGSESVRWVACAPDPLRRREGENRLKRGTARGTEGVREAEKHDSFREREGGLNAGVCSQFGLIVVEIVK